MSSMTYPDKLKAIANNPALLRALSLLQRGIEKESLRITPAGKLALTDHPVSLGSTLCHPKITTDYSEALLEFITPVHQSINNCLADLYDIHHYTYECLEEMDELLWTASMPCQLVKAEDIPVARYGSSNVAKMKTVYRLGLGHRYGRVMQTISGVHYNFSLSEKFLASYQLLLNNRKTMPDFKTEQYLGLIRNFHRFVPAFIYLFGASPAICRSFLQGQTHHLRTEDDHSWFGDYATSLRMSDLGYQSKEQSSLSVCYNSLDNYVDSLRKAITEPWQAYEKIGLKDKDGNYQQLNTSLLQIENEFYSTIRPKRVAASGEAPINALSRRGVEYIEVRCVDIDPFTPLGIDARCIRFLDLFLLYCLLEDSPPLLDEECQQTHENLKTIVEDGRKSNIHIQHHDSEVLFVDWAGELLDKLEPLAHMLDTLYVGDDYMDCLKLQRQKLVDTSLTPSALLLHHMQDKQITFAEAVRRQSVHWQQHFLEEPLSNSKRQQFQQMALDSLAQQKTIEQADKLSFDDYLAQFYQQYFNEL